MIVDPDIAAIIQKAQNASDYRTVIMQDVKSGHYVEGKFTHPYDTDLSCDAVRQLFDSAYETLSVFQGQSFNAQSLPVIQFIGRFNVTLITKRIDGGVDVIDATNADVERYMGIES